jgi:hypothetical protein
MPVRKPRKPAKPSSRGRASIPDVLPSTGGRGAGVQFVDQLLSPVGETKSVDLGSGLPKARQPKVATTPAAVEARAFSKRMANKRRSSANNVVGYVKPGLSTQRGPLPTASDLLDMTAPRTPEMPDADDLLRLTSDQAYPLEAFDEGTYVFPQVSPTRTIEPQRPRTLEAGWERIRDPNHPSYPGVLRVRFRDGTPWEYYNVPNVIWQRFKRVQSPGKFINRVLNDFDYGRGDF